MPTGRTARYAGGLSVAKFLNTPTYQRIDSDEGVRAIARHVVEISRADLIPAHVATATKVAIAHHCTDVRRASDD